MTLSTRDISLLLKKHSVNIKNTIKTKPNKKENYFINMNPMKKLLNKKPRSETTSNLPFIAWKTILKRNIWLLLVNRVKLINWLRLSLQSLSGLMKMLGLLLKSSSSNISKSSLMPITQYTTEQQNTETDKNTTTKQFNFSAWSIKEQVTSSQLISG